VGIGLKARFVSVGIYDARASAIRSRIDRLDVPARAIFILPAVFKREALTVAT